MDTVSVGDRFGAGLIGAIITGVLYGITTVQTYLYFVNYPKDTKTLKSMVAIVWILDTAHIVLVAITMYHYLVTNYDNPAGLRDIHWSLPAGVTLNLVLGIISQGFFTQQVHTIARGLTRWILSPILIMLVFLHFVFGIETVAWLVIEKTYERFQTSELVKLAGATPFAISAVLSDIVVAVSLCVLLRDSRTGIGKTNMLITTLMIYAVNRCLLTSAVAIVEVIVFIATPGSLWFIAIDFVIGKLYANSLLASLNSRNALRARSSQSGAYISADTSTVR
ncbi:hypothetical protein Moror_9917 [Moniliophthora roreri MCA 2997]|uniref:DUF6534 domain-containing protein n=1 Tax=Moniliophthora roreri (strain MCA 2997) TaxID=1381753 RepID=V2WZU8_MONRO|nr:hypothetical protein Moror_9917 [Moniliophthora roreri MCA 2997]